MELTVNYLGNVQFEAEARGHKLICDQPFENRGDNEGMTPPELLLASIGTCAGFYAVEYLRARNLATVGVSIRVTAGKVKDPAARMTGFVIEVTVPGLEDERHIEGVRRAVDKCLVKNTLKVPPSMQTVVNGLVAEPTTMEV